MSKWWKCNGSGEMLPELSPCEVLAETPEMAALEYARCAHEEISPEDRRVRLTVGVYDDEIDDWRSYSITSERIYRPRVEG